MRGDLVYAILALIAALGCTKPPPPQPATPVEAVYGKLVEGGCLDPSATTSDVAAEHALPDQPPWLACLFDGGTVQSCSVPCDPTANSHR